MKLHFQHIATFSNQEHASDVELFIKLSADKQLVRTDKQQLDDTPLDHLPGCCLVQFPAHQHALFGAEYFEAQFPKRAATLCQWDALAALFCKAAWSVSL
jgi:hypothetical protein